MLQTDSDCLFLLWGTQCTSIGKEHFYLPAPLVWPYGDQKAQPDLPVPLTSSTTTGSSRIVSFNPERVVFQAAKRNQAQVVCNRLHKWNPGFRRPLRYLSWPWNELGHRLQPQHWTGFPQFEQCSKRQIILTGMLGDPGMLLLSRSYINLPGINLSLSRMKPVIQYCPQNYFSKVNSVPCTS